MPQDSPSSTGSDTTRPARRGRRRWWLAGAALLALTVAQVGCTNLGFYWQATRGQIDVLTRRVPVDEALATAALSDTQRSRLQAAFEAREFASQELGLPDNRSYRTYADIERPYVVWNVFAAPEFSVDPKTWCFPFAGCVSYRGYFSEQAARKHAGKLRAEGFDAFYGGIAAYSTLGTFADPILNTMLRQDELDTVALIFHELSHQQVYRPGDAAFSESFASFVEREGVRRWLASGRAGRNEDYLASLTRQREFAELIATARAALGEIYALDVPEAEMRARKAEQFDRLRESYAALRDRWGGYSGYDRWFERDLNNAHLASVATYWKWVPAFGQLLRSVDGDLIAFYAAAEALAELDQETLDAKMQDLQREAEAVFPRFDQASLASGVLREPETTR